MRALPSTPPVIVMSKGLFQACTRFASAMGFDPYTALRTSRGWGWFARDLIAFQRQTQATGTPFPIASLHPCLDDRNAESGAVSPHYFYQDLLVAQRVFARSPQRHVDVGSRVDGFVAHVASFRPIEVFDIRPLTRQIPNVTFRRADLMNLGSDYIGITDSLSCLHALEHLGLGRYGDALDPEGHLKGLAALHAIVRSGGILYLSVPIGPQRIEFNAHRVFAVSYLLEIVEPMFKVEACSFVDDDGELHENVDLEPAAVASNFGCTYGCGIFELRRT